MRWFTVLLIAATASSVSCVDAWWNSAVVYQIYPRSFKDSDGDGIGDLTGIKESLPYLQELGVDAIWLSPIYKSPMLDFGYDISNYTDIATEYGTMDDFDALIAEAKRLGIRVVLDYVPNHTSHESWWFKNSTKSIGKYKDYYVWANGTYNGTVRNPPSNWISIFRNSAWEYNEDRQEYYLHQFVTGQPDINYRCPELREEMREVLRFWLRKGVSGFRVDAVNMLYEVDPALYGGIFPDEPLSNTTTDSADYNYLLHPYTKDQNETYEVVYNWREVLDEFAANESKIMMTEAYTDIDLMMRYYGNATHNGSMPFNFIFLGELSGSSTANDMKTVVEKWMTNMPSGKTANWVNGNHDQSRMATRHGVERVDAMNMLALILPGVTITYQGEELGMTDGFLTWEQTVDPQACNTNDPINYWKTSRDVARTPFHWDATTSAGFSTNSTTWIPVASNYQTVNVAVEKATAKSHYKFYKDVVALKHTPAVSAGSLGTTAYSDNVLVVTRVPTNASDPAVVGILNLAATAVTVDLAAIVGVPQTMRVVASGVECALNKEIQVERSSIYVSPHCAMVLQTVTSGDTTSGTTAPSSGTTAPSSGTTAPSSGTTAPSSGSTAGSSGTTAPSSGTTAPPNGTTVAPNGTTAAPGSAPRFVAPLILYSIMSLIHVWLQ